VTDAAYDSDDCSGSRRRLDDLRSKERPILSRANLLRKLVREAKERGSRKMKAA